MSQTNGRQQLAQLTKGDAVHEVYLVQRCEVRTTRAGGVFLAFEFSDQSGTMKGNLWDAKAEWAQEFPPGTFVTVKAQVETYRDVRQLKILGIDPADPRRLCPADFMPATPFDLDEMEARLRARLGELSHPGLRALGAAFLADEEFVRRLRVAPAAQSRHHAYLGGLLEHVVSTLDVAAFYAGHYPHLRRDLLYLGVFLHDLGKVYELSWQTTLGYTPAGKLVGHLVMGVELLDRYLAQVEGVPETLALELKHLIVAHHGELQFGSPKLPAIAEAMVVHHIENLDAKIWTFQRCLAEAGEDGWTTWSKEFGGPLYAGSRLAEA